MIDNIAYPKARIAVFSKAPEAGKVKTRLIPHIGEPAATELHTRFLQQTVEMARKSGLCEVELWCSPQTGHAVFKSLKVRHDIQLRLQYGKSLGERMVHTAGRVLAEAEQLVIIGTDCPDMDRDYIAQSLQALQAGNDIVLGPAEDGGYVLIAMCKFMPGIFSDIDWGTEQVLVQTLRKIQQYRLSYTLLKPLWDVDRIEDYQRYQRSISIPS